MSHSLLPGIQWIFAICFYGKELSGGMGEAVLILQSYYEILEMFPFLPRTKIFEFYTQEWQMRRQYLKGG